MSGEIEARTAHRSQSLRAGSELQGKAGGPGGLLGCGNASWPVPSCCDRCNGWAWRVEMAENVNVNNKLMSVTSFFIDVLSAFKGIFLPKNISIGIKVYNCQTKPNIVN